MRTGLVTAGLPCVALNSPGHARRGLMRASIDARDFADLRSGAFSLDAPAGEWIRGTAAPSASPQTRLARFAYAPQDSARTMP